MRHVTFISAYYENPRMLQRQFASFAALPPEVRSHYQLIIIDDCSAKYPATPPSEKYGFKYSIFRLTVKKPWNQDACRNLGAAHAKGWMLLTDIDHMVPELTATRLVMGGVSDDDNDFDDGTVYRFSRVSAPNMNPYREHPNSWFLTREMFERSGGYDERFAGLYGTDWDVRDRLGAVAPIVTLTSQLVRVPREVIPDASTTAFKRKTPEDGAMIAQIKQSRAIDPEWKPLRGSFPWEQVC